MLIAICQSAACTLRAKPLGSFKPFCKGVKAFAALCASGFGEVRRDAPSRLRRLLKMRPPYWLSGFASYWRQRAPLTKDHRYARGRVRVICAHAINEADAERFLGPEARARYRNAFGLKISEPLRRRPALAPASGEIGFRAQRPR